MVNGSFSKTLFLVSVQARGGVTEAGDDYWDEDYDSDKNCEQEEKIAKLSIEVDAHDLNKDNVDYDKALLLWGRNYLTIFRQIT